MKLIAAGLRHDANLAASPCPEFRSVIARLDPELLDIFEARLQPEWRIDFRVKRAGIGVDRAGAFNTIVSNSVLLGRASREPNRAKRARTGVRRSGRLQV